MFNGRQTDYDDTVILNSGFWCDISVSEFQKTRAIPFNIPDEMVKSVLVSAMQGVEIDLADVASLYQNKGLTKVSEVSSVMINNENYAETLYKKAVFARAKADLLSEFNTLSAREIHENRKYADEQKSLLAEATFAIRTLKGKKRSAVWLI
ncbi:head completion protein GPL [Volucribacter psittacicida]|uniref:Head completion protein GPL n=1 Tax=Volucribacter psittacicida TaxID=203482 RepID=A0A4R1FYB7_9PAST|nr:head completion/stabilization protein [Volucribacter psittacicida]TCJ98824.1 head completion protein GPL [Volucribacter psittacicida]